FNFFLGIQKRPAFFVGSRYGRSTASTTSGTTGNVESLKTRRLVVVPRNDHFFLGSRYGKRSGELLPCYMKIKLSVAFNKRTEKKGEKRMSSISARIERLMHKKL
ncbi:hypothetical protein KR084_007703, partial [Drosophila pseudotakahashii]